MTDEFEPLEGADGPHRRDFLKGLVLGAAFASPLVSSFTMSGVESVFGGAAGATTLMSNSNTAGPKYPTKIICGSFNATGGTLTGTVTINGNTVTATLVVPAGAFPRPSAPICLWLGDPQSFTSVLPAGTTPKSPVGVSWFFPNATVPLTLTVTDSRVQAGDQIFTDTGQPQTGTVSNGTWTTSFTQDPNFVVATPPAVPGGAPAAPATAAGPRFTG
jgi:hypothetical protein